MTGLDPGTLALLVLIAAAAGIGGGVLAGLLGVGGGIVIVPALYVALNWAGMDAGITHEDRRGHIARNDCLHLAVVELWPPSAWRARYGAAPSLGALDPHRGIWGARCSPGS